MGKTGSGTEIFHRKRARIPAKVLHRDYADATVRRMEVEVLRDVLEGVFSFPRFPFMPIDEFGDDVDKIARTVRAAWQLPDGPVFNVTRTLEENGGIVVAHKFDRRIDGFGSRTTGLPPVFHMNRDLPPDRWRWTLAHEIGHLVMHSEFDARTHDVEKQAHRFAAEFLAPAHQIEPQLRNLDIGRLAPLKMEWKISMQALVMRARDLRGIDILKHKSLMIQLSNDGYRTREPVNLDPPVEYPSLLHDLVQYCEDSMEFSREEVLMLLNIGESDFWTYYRDPDDWYSDLMGPPDRNREESLMSEPVANLQLSAISPPVHVQLKCASEDIGQDQKLLDALHLLQREGVIPEQLVGVGEERVRNRIEVRQRDVQSLRDLERLYNSSYD